MNILCFIAGFCAGVGVIGVIIALFFLKKQARPLQDMNRLDNPPQKSDNKGKAGKAKFIDPLTPKERFSMAEKIDHLLNG